jgi:hypothetical protein
MAKTATTHADAVHLSGLQRQFSLVLGIIYGLPSGPTKPAVLQPILRCDAVKLQSDVAVQCPAIFASEDVKVHLGCVHSQFAAGADCPVGYDTSHLVVGQIVFSPEQRG